MKLITALGFIGLILLSIQADAQSDFYDINTVPEIKLYFDDPNWDQILDSLYIAGEEERMLANIEIDGSRYDSIGIRYKGFSSVSVNRTKNPFNIKLDFVNDQNHNGIEKIKLSNVIQDPSFLREVLSYEIARKYMPASRSNFANVYINDVYWGLYTNVEAVNKAFLRNHYSSDEGTFIKANPKSLDLNGENCNLSDSPGLDSINYYDLYEMKSDDGWGDLLELIDILNNDIDQIENILNVDRTLWMHAFNYVLINFDSYIGYAQNYYVYRDNNGQFNPIIWDLNQSFASYRLTDASIHFRGFSIEEAKTMDPLLHLNEFSVHPRPLMRKLFENDRYRKMYLAHIRTILEENFVNQHIAERGKIIQRSIDQWVKSDTNKFYTYESFIENLDGTVNELIEYPGINDLMKGRVAYMNNYPGFKTDLIISNPMTDHINNELWIKVHVENAKEVFLFYRSHSSDLFEKIQMFDDGMHNDQNPNDGIYGVNVSNSPQNMEYYFYAEDEITGLFLPERAAYEFFRLDNVKPLVINEFCASNESINADDQGDFDDWIELYNNSDNTIDLKGYYLSDDNSELDQWEFPDTSIRPDSYLIVWADKDEGDAGLHANFKLSASGETVVLSNQNEEIQDEINFSEQQTDITYGRYQNGIGDFYFMKPTPGAYNNGPLSNIEESTNLLLTSKVFPNPTNGIIHLTELPDGEYRMEIQDLNGKTYQSEEIRIVNQYGFLSIKIDHSGMYLLNISSDKGRITHKIVLN